MSGTALPIARCPVTHRALRPLAAAELEELNERIRTGATRYRDGTPVLTPLRDGLVAAGGEWAYRIDDGVAGLLATLAIELGEPGADVTTLRVEKQAVRDFYEEVGWKKAEGELFEDTTRFTDTRPVMREYYRACRLRIGRPLPQAGDYLLDVASGPVQFPEYVDYQTGFAQRICVDFSALALREARGNVGPKGVLVQGDITNLPLADDSVDAVISLHTIYHVPRDEQPTAFRELHRVLRPGGAAVVAYSWGHTAWGELSPARRLLHLPARVVGKARRTLRSRGARPPGPEAGEPELYFHAFDHHWFVHQPWPFRSEVLSHRLFTSEFLEAVVHERLAGRQLLAVINWIEERFPRAAGRFGRYPLIVIHKD